MTCIFNNCYLHAQANSKERNMIFPGMTYRFYFTFYPSWTKATGH